MKGWTLGDLALAYNQARRRRQDPVEAIARQLFLSTDEVKKGIKAAREKGLLHDGK